MWLAVTAPKMPYSLPLRSSLVYIIGGNALYCPVTTGFPGTDHFLVTLLDRLSNEWPAADVPGKTSLVVFIGYTPYNYRH